MKVRYVEKNETDSMVIVGTQIHVETVGFAHESGVSEGELVERFNLTKEQFYGALAYFYGNRERLIADEAEIAEQARKMAQKGTEKLRTWRKNKAK